MLYLRLGFSHVPDKSLLAEVKLAVNLAPTLALRLTGQFKLAAPTSRCGLKQLSELPLTIHEEQRSFETIAPGHWGLSLLFSGDFYTATKALHHSVSFGA